MIPNRLNRPCSSSAVRNFFNSSRVAAALSAVLLLSPLAHRALAQNDDANRVVSSRMERGVPMPRPVFTDTPAAQGDNLADLPESVRAANASDDFDNSTPTAWWVYNGQTIDQVSALVTQLGARIIDVQVESFSPYKVTVTMVKNTGAYAKTWWWYVGLTEAQVTSAWQTNGARLTSLKAYDIGGGNIRFAVVMIKNSGADARAWWWYVGQTVNDITSLWQTNKARLITVDPYATGGKTYYSTIMVDNTGTNATTWYWYINVSPATLASLYQTDNARITYLTPGSSGTLDAIMESCASGCSEWWWYYGLSGTQMVNTAVQNGARLINAATYPGCGGACFMGAMINNSNAVTSRVGNIIRNGISGTEGLYLAQVSGPGTHGTLANLEDGVAFEPASTLKVVANLYSERQVQQGNIKLTTQITHYADGPESCPVPTISGTERLATGLREMMWHSDNGRTAEVTDHWGFTKLNNYAASIGMKHTAFNEYIGCTGHPNSLTLDDAAALYTGVAEQEPLFLNAKNRGIFYSNMAGRAQFESEGYDWTAVWSTDIPNIINQVAPAGTTAQQKQAYMNAMNVAYKAGNYVLCTNNSCTDVVEDISIAGWFQIPVCTASATTYAEYVWGIMFSNEPYNGWTSTTTTQTDLNFTAAKSELMREQIAAGMLTCKGKSLEVMMYSPADLVFGSSTSPIKVGKTTASKTITLTNKQPTTVTGLNISVFGDFVETSTCGASLASGKSCTISVDFEPAAVGERTGAVIITDNGTGQPQTVELTGTGG